VTTLHNYIYHMEVLYEEAASHYKSIYSSMVNSTTRVKLTSSILQDMQSVFTEFARNVERVTARFNAEILQESGTAWSR
jgi:hypothetical protein